MGNVGRNIIKQKVGQREMITQDFVRQVKNFINNFDVTGGNMRFDGVRARLTVDGGGGGGASPINFALTLQKDETGTKIRIGSGYVTTNDIWDNDIVETPDTYTHANPKYWGNLITIAPTTGWPGVSWPSNPERITGTSLAPGAISFGNGFPAQEPITDYINIADGSTAQIYLVQKTMATSVGADFPEGGEWTDSIFFEYYENQAEYKLPSRQNDVSGEGQVTYKYCLIADIVAKDISTGGNPDNIVYTIRQYQKHPICFAAQRNSSQDDGSGGGGGLPPGTEGQGLFRSPVSNIPEFAYREFTTHVDDGDTSTIIVEPGTVVGPFEGLDHVSTTGDTITTLYTENYIYCEVYGVPGAGGWRLIEDGIPGEQAAYPAIVNYATIQEEDYNPASALPGGRVFRFPIALADVSLGAVTQITQLAQGNVYFNRDSTATAIRYKFYLASGSTIEADTAEIMTGYDPEIHDDWSAEFTVASGAITGKASPFGVVDTEINNADASADPVQVQDVYRIPIIRDNLPVSMAGTFRENIYCAGAKGPIVELLKIG